MNRMVYSPAEGLDSFGAGRRRKVARYIPRDMGSMMTSTTSWVQPEKLITHRYHGMEQIPEAMNLFLHHDRSLIKPVIYND